MQLENPMRINQATLVDYLNHQLSPAEQARVATALERDPRLRAELTQLQRLHAGLQAAFGPIRDVPIATRTERTSFGPAQQRGRLARMALLAALLLAGLWVARGRLLAASGTAGGNRMIAVVPATQTLAPNGTPISEWPLPTIIPASDSVPTPAPPAPGSPEWYTYLTISPSLTLRGEVPGTILDIAVQGKLGYALVSDPGGATASLITLDLSKPAAPARIGTYAVAEESRAIAVAGPLLLVGTPHGFDVLDVSTPAAIALLGSYADPELAGVGALAVRDQLAYLTGSAANKDGRGSLAIIDLADPTNPWLRGSIATAGASAEGLDVVGTLAYVADSSAGLHLIDISDPNDPRLLGTFTSEGARTVRVAGEHAYLGTDHGLEIIDVSTPTAPFAIAGPIPIAAPISGLALSGDLIFVSYGDFGSSDFGGIEVYDVSDAAGPRLIGRYSAQANAYAVRASGGRAYVAHGRRGLLIIDLAR
jgi:hypothetical protein